MKDYNLGDKANYRDMYYHLAGRMVSAVETLEATVGALSEITEGLKKAQQTTEDMFIDSFNNDEQ